MIILPPFVAPPVEKPSCSSCKTFAPECLVPVGEAAVPMCWICAHHVVDHGVSVEHAFISECDCDPHRVYPAHVIAKRAAVC